MKAFDSKSKMLEHTKAKIELYTNYLSIFLNIIQRDRYTKRIYLYDLFCGEGKYSDGSKGSPLAALDVIEKHFYENGKRITTIKILFNDINKEKIERLKNFVDDCFIPYNCRIYFANEDYNNLIRHVIEEIQQFENEKGLIFIDPHGYKYTKISDIQRLLSGNKTEIILFLPISFMYRFAKASIRDELPGYKPLKEFLEDVFYRGTPNFKTKYDFTIQLKKAFREKLGRYYIDTFTLERDPTNIYCLFFFTSHIRGFEKMLDAKWKMDEQEGRGFTLDKQRKLFTFRENYSFLLRVLEFIKSKEDCTNKDLYKFGLLNGYLPKHLKEILGRFQKEEKIFVFSDNQDKIKKGAFYLDYKNHSPKEKNIVYFKINED